MEIKAVIFDMDGLMFNSEAVWKKCWKLSAKHFNLPLTEQHRQKLVGRTMEDNEKYLQELFPNHNMHNFMEYVSTLVNSMLEQRGAKPKKGLFSLLKFLQNNNIKFCIVSASSKNKILTLLKKANISKSIFNCIVCGDDNLTGKPAPDMFLHAAKLMNVPAENIVVLEDSPNGILGASAANCIPVMIPDLIMPTEEIKEHCHKVLKNLNQVIKLIKNTNK